MDKNNKGAITKNEMLYAMVEMDVGLSVFEINQILEILGLDDGFTRLYKAEFKKKLKKLMRQNKINLLQNFSISLLARIQRLVETKHRNLLEAFKEEDQYNTGFADLKHMQTSLEKFGLHNIKKHEIKTLINVFKSEINYLNPEEDYDDESESGNNKKDKTLSLDMFADMPEAKNDKNEPKKKEFDIEDPNFKIDYKEFAGKIYNEIESNGKLFKGSYQVLRKVYNMAKMKPLTLFEVYVYFDVNNLNQISNMELRLGLQNLEISLEKYEFDNLWNVFQKNENNKVTFSSFLEAFINASCFEIIKFDDKVKNLLKRFTFLITKHGNYEELFRQFDSNDNGYVTLDQFKLRCDDLRLGLQDDELDLIFRELCSPESLGLGSISNLNIPTLEQKQGDNNKDDSQDKNEKKPFRYFNYKKFVLVLSYFRKKDQQFKMLYKLDSILKERGVTYKQILRNYQEKQKKRKGKNKSFDMTKKTSQNGIEITELKSLLQSLELGLSNDELDSIVDSFEDEYITVNIIEKKIRTAVTIFERQNNKKASIFTKAVTELQEFLNKEHVSLRRLFQDFETRADGTLNLEEFSKMFEFLRMRLNKKETKIIFDEINFDKKQVISYKEFQNFYDQNLFNKQNFEENNDDNKPKNGIDLIIKKMQDAAIENKTSLDRILATGNVSLNHVAILNVFEKLLMKMNCVLKRDEIKLVFEAASRDGITNYGDLIDWGIKNKIDNRQQENSFPQFPPAVQVILSKMLQIFKKMDLSVEIAFKYFSNDNPDLSMRSEFLILVQGLQIQTNQEELIALYTFFDVRNYGEISRNGFLDKCQLANNFYRWNQQEDMKESKGVMTLTLRQHVMSALEKIHGYFMDKNFNKTQIFSVFDKNGTGMISRENFIQMIEFMKIQIPLEHLNSSLNFLDPEETGIINIGVFMKKMIEAVPEHAKNTFRNALALNILGSILGKLKIHMEKFKSEFLDLEQKLQIDDILARNRTGVPIYEFYRLLSTYGIRLEENDKLLLNASFKHKKKADYFSTELLFMSIERLAKEVGSLNNLEGENVEYWESQVLRKVADRLRKLNLTLEQAFSKISNNNFGFVKKVDFKQLILSLEIDLSQKDIDLLIKRLVSAQNPSLISFQEFRARFWNCFFEGKSQMHPLNISNRSRQIAAMFLHKIKFDMRMPLSVAWDGMDIRKSGNIELNDLKEFLISINMPITKQDLGFLFTLIDKDKDGAVDQYEFAEFWNLNLPADFEVKKLKLKKLENDVLGKISKFLNQKNNNLSDLVRIYDQESKGFFNLENFGQMLKDINIDLGESTLKEIMKMVSANTPDRIYFSDLETALLRNGLKYITKRGMNVLEFKNKLMEQFLNALNHGANKEKIKVDNLLTKFDEDYDGYLTQDEFYNLVRTLPHNFDMVQFQRISHLFASRDFENKIEIAKIMEILKNFKKTENKINEGLCDYEIFKKTIEKFDPTLQLFKRWNQLKQAEQKFVAYLNANKDAIRGFRLISLQVKVQQIQEKLKVIEDNLKLASAFLKNKSTKLITDNTKLKFLDKAYNDMVVQDMQMIDVNGAPVLDNQIFNSQQFNVENNSKQSINPYVTEYQGTLIQEITNENFGRGFDFENANSNHKYNREVNHVQVQSQHYQSMGMGSNSSGGISIPVKIHIYPPKTLLASQPSGKTMGQHLLYALQVQKMLTEPNSASQSLFTQVYGFFEKATNVEKTEKELLIFHEILSNDWVDFETFINSTGGLVRIPFLMISGAVAKIAKFWFRKIIEIVDTVRSKNAVLINIKPKDFWVNVKTLEVKYSGVVGSGGGVGKLGDDKSLQLVPDFKYLSENKLAEAESSEEDIKGKKTRSDPYDDSFIAPEFIYENPMNLTANIDSYALGALLHFIIFGEYPKKMSSFIPMKILKNTQEPNDFVYFDIISEDNIKTIMAHDYDVQVGKDYSMLINALDQCSFQSVFDKFLDQNKQDNEDGMSRGAQENMDGQTGWKAQSGASRAMMQQSNFQGSQVGENNRVNQSGLPNIGTRSNNNFQKSEIMNTMASKLKQEVKEDPKYYEQKIGDYVDLILVLMSWKPHERPAPRVLLNSKLFSSDSYQLMQMKQFSSVSFFYRSPSKCIREGILIPLRRMQCILKYLFRCDQSTSACLTLVLVPSSCTSSKGSHWLVCQPSYKVHVICVMNS